MREIRGILSCRGVVLTGTDQTFTEAKILLVDDEEINLLLLERILHRAGYTSVRSTPDPREAIEIFQEFQPDLVCTDLHMPFMSGIGLLESLQKFIDPKTYLPIIILTADLSSDAEHEALTKGAKDFLNKPFQANQIRLRLHNLLQTRFLQLELQRQNEMLEEKVKNRTIELEAARLDALERLALAAEYRDHTTGMHTKRVGDLSALIALKLGFSEEEVDLVRRAAPLHDVGKIGIPDDILLKPGKLTNSEFDVMKAHVNLGSSLLSHGQSQLTQLAEKIALTHHERWDGSGYPLGLKGDDIPLVGQIVAVADVFDTLINERPYKEPWPIEKAIEEIKHQSGKWFSPRVVAVFLEVAMAHNQAVMREKNNSLSVPPL